MLKFGSLVLTLLVAMAPAAIAQSLGTATSPAPEPATAQKGRVLTQQGRIFDEDAVADPRPGEPKGAQLGGSSPQSDQARTMRNPTVTQGLKVSREKSPGTTPGSGPGNEGVDPYALKGAPVAGSPHEMSDGTAKTHHDTSKDSINNIKAREAAVGVPGGSVLQNGTPGTAVRETALGGPDTTSRDKLKGTTKTSKPLAVGQTVPDVDVSMPKIGQPVSR